MVPTHRVHVAGVDGFPGSALPVLVWRGALVAAADRQAATFAAHGWSNAWQNGLYDFDHFHSTAHEVLGIATGWVDVALGAGAGPTLRLAAGDAIALPAGVAHRNAGASADLSVVGAYDGGRDWDLRRGRADERDAVAAAIARVPLPRRDPIDGGPSGLAALWAAAVRLPPGPASAIPPAPSGTARR